MTEQTIPWIVENLDVIEEPCKWNAARYERIYDHALTVALIKEEAIDEFHAADETDVLAKIDGAADVWFVAIGGLWKLGIDNIDEVLDSVCEHVAYVPSLIAAAYWFEHADTEMARVYTLAVCAIAAVDALRRLGFNEEQASYILGAICRSNNTKAVKKTASGVKANIDKGIEYIPPTAELKQILKEVQNEPLH